MVSLVPVIGLAKLIYTSCAPVISARDGTKSIVTAPEKSGSMLVSEAEDAGKAAPTAVTFTLVNVFVMAS